MPKYTFNCECGYSTQKIVSRNKKSISCPECGKEVTRSMPRLSGAVDVEENVDDFKKKWKKDQKQLLDERQQKYYWEHEVPKMVNSGVYGLDTMLENGWVYYDEKGQLQTRTKPPRSS